METRFEGGVKFIVEDGSRRKWGPKIFSIFFGSSRYFQEFAESVVGGPPSLQIIPLIF